MQKRRAGAAPSGTQSKGGALLRFLPGVMTETFEEALRPSSSTAPMVWRPSGTEWKKVSFGRDEPMYVPLRYHQTRPIAPSALIGILCCRSSGAEM